jgi:UDP-N-acetylglucosamine 2-epimerase (non-hydrolysing)/UDP-GlcNAc3NAcA epimerase
VTRLLAVIGTRPQFIKYAALAPTLEGAFSTFLVDTGQHYDPELSSHFLDELTIRRPDRVLDGRRDGVAGQIADMIEGVDSAIGDANPDVLLCMGDTNSTLAACLAGIKNAVPVAHIEAGERNFRRDGTRIPPWSAPEEVNRLMVDQGSSLLLCASRRGLENLVQEGRADDAVFTGDLMWDLHQRVAGRMVAESDILERLGLQPGQFVFCTVHRAGNTDSPDRLERIVAALESLSWPVVIPIHPRTRLRLEQADLYNRLSSAPGVRVIDPIAYGDSVALGHEAHCVITDSGGVTREAFFSGVPSVILDENTAWIDIVRSGWAVLAGADRAVIIEGASRPVPLDRPDLFGDGRAARLIVDALSEWAGA